MRLARWMMLIAVCAYAQAASALIFYRISGISNINLPNWSIGDGPVAASIDVCAYTTLLGNYAITASSPGGFVLTSGANQIAYTLKWESSGAGNLGSSGGSALTNNAVLQNQPNSNIYLFADDCSGGAPAGPTARLTLNITNAEMTAAKAGTYTGTLTLTMSAL